MSVSKVFCIYFSCPHSEEEIINVFYFIMCVKLYFSFNSVQVDY